MEYSSHSPQQWFSSGLSANNLNKLYLLYFSLAKDFHIFATFFDIISGLDMLAVLFFIKDNLKKSIQYTQFSVIMERKKEKNTFYTRNRNQKGNQPRLLHLTLLKDALLEESQLLLQFEKGYSPLVCILQL